MVVVVVVVVVVVATVVVAVVVVVVPNSGLGGLTILWNDDASQWGFYNGF